jgi:DNA-binding MarR family transcriptional regulator
MHVKPPRWDPAASPTFWINHASRLILRHFEERLRPLDFGFAYLPVVMALREQGPLLQKELAEKARVEQPTMAALLARMERDGVISRRPHPTDGRSTLVTLTTKAKRRLPAALHELSNVVEGALDGISDAERAGLVTLLQRVVTNLAGANRE